MRYKSNKSTSKLKGILITKKWRTKDPVQAILDVASAPLRCYEDPMLSYPPAEAELARMIYVHHCSARMGLRSVTACASMIVLARTSLAIRINRIDSFVALLQHHPRVRQN